MVRRPPTRQDWRAKFLQAELPRHGHREWTKSDGAKYKAAHESLVQRWRTGDTGSEYTPRLNARIAEAMLETETPRVDRLREGDREACGM